MRAYGGIGVETKSQKSQAKATIFLVMFLLLVPTVLAIGYTGSVTGDVVSTDGIEGISEQVIGSEDPITTAESSPQADVLPIDEPDTTGAPEAISETTTEPTTEAITNTLEETESIPETETDPQDTPKLISSDPVEDPPQPEQAEEPTTEIPIEPDQTEQVTNQEENNTESDPVPEPDTETAENHTEIEIGRILETPVINETQPSQPETNQTNQISNETNTGTDSNETGINSTQPVVPALPGACNITCGDCETLNVFNCTCASDDGCQPPEDPVIPIPPVVPEKPEFSITLSPSARITRGTTVQFVATITNTGKGTALSVRPYWIMPIGLQLISTNDDCDMLVPDSACTLTGQVYVQPDIIGRKEIRIMVDYE